MQKIENISLGKNKSNSKTALSYLKRKKKSLPTKYLYDEKGSNLFEKICNTEEYYLTRTEQKILNKYSAEIISYTKVKEFLELGSGSSKKTKILLMNALEQNAFMNYSSLDISEKALKMSFNELESISKKLKINLYKGDFLHDLNNLPSSKNNRLFLFLGSTLGNFDDDTAIKLLKEVEKKMNKNDFFLLGVDKIKDEKVITSAYNDKQGYTKQFNLNILNVINKKYNLNFNQENFNHHALYNQTKSQVEMYLESIRKQNVMLPDDNILSLAEGEKILTEISRKFSDETLSMLLKKSSLRKIKSYSDNKKYFTLYLLKSTKYF